MKIQNGIFEKLIFLFSTAIFISYWTTIMISATIQGDFQKINKNVRVYNLIKNLTLEHEDSQILRSFVDNVIQIDQIDDEENTALIWAAYKGNHLIAQMLIDMGAGIDLQNDDNMTALMMASRHGHFLVVKQLIEAGAQLELRRPDIYRGHETTLIIASVRGHLQVVQELIKAGAEVDGMNRDRSTALMFACQYGHLPVVQALINAGAEVDGVNCDRKTALTIACQYGHLPVVQALLESGAQPKLRDSNNMTSLMWAAKNGNLQIVQILLESGVRTNLRCNNGKTALDYAKNSQVVCELKIAGGNLNDKKMVLWDVIDNGEVEFVRKLRLDGIDFNFVNMFGTSPLRLAVKNGNVEVVKELIVGGANVFENIWWKKTLIDDAESTDIVNLIRNEQCIKKRVKLIQLRLYGLKSSGLMHLLKQMPNHLFRQVVLFVPAE